QEGATNSFLQTNRNVLVPHLEPQKGLLADRLQKNEAELLEFAKTVNSASKEMKAIFATEGLTKDTVFQPLRERNKAVKIGTIDQLHVCQRLNGKLEAMHRLLNMPFKSSCKDVSDNFERVSILSKRAMQLLYGLSTAQATVENKMDEMQKALLAWIEKDLSLHDKSPFLCTADELSYLHKWSLCLLGRFYFSPDLSDAVRKSTVQLLRTNTKPLFSHLRAFGHDVKLSFAKHSLEMSLLVLATISCRLEKEYGSQRGVVQLLKPDEIGFLSRGFARLGLGSKEPEKSDKPLIDLDTLDASSISRVGNRDVILNYLLCAYQYYNIGTLETLNAEDSVSLFRICKFIEMPRECAKDLKDLLQGKLEEKLVKPVLWLLLATALEINLPYATLQKLFKKISLEELHEWVLLYKSEHFDRTSIDHHKLFFAVTEAVEHLFENRSQFTATDEIARTFSHVLEIYAEVLGQKFDESERNRLDHRLIQFGCRAVERAGDANVAQFIGKIGGKDIRASIVHLDSETLDEIVMITKNPQVVKWLREHIVPNLQTLELNKTLDQFVDLGVCKSVTKVRMPLLKGENMATAGFQGRFPALQVLELSDGVLAVKDIMHLPLTSVTLKRIDNVIDCSGGDMKNHVRTLVLDDVAVERDSLSWLAGCQNLEEITVKAKGDSCIGKLAIVQQVQEKQKLRTCSLLVKNLDADAGLKTSLPLLLNSHETLSTLTVCSTDGEESILDLLLQSEKAKYTIQHLTISCNANDVQKLARLVEFTNLKTVCLRIVDKTIRTQIDHVNFDAIKLPKGLKITRADSKGNKVVTVYPKE
ncbi:MAG: hypothetical protein LLF94_05755, partial [Chlamydiales bacterium]|nr:hypothetical protein [Chlamydiales bacterium]